MHDAWRPLPAGYAQHQPQGAQQQQKGLQQPQHCAQHDDRGAPFTSPL